MRFIYQPAYLFRKALLNHRAMPGVLEPSATMFYQNQYLGNAAMAGIDSGLHINAAHRRQWQNSIEGAPVSTFVTADCQYRQSAVALV